MRFEHSSWLAALLVFFGQPLALARANQTADERTLQRAGIEPNGKALLEFLRRHSARGDANEIQRLVRQLGSRAYRVREKASRELIALGARSVAELQRVKEHPDLEVRRRAAECLRAIQNTSASESLRAAARLLAKQKPQGAAEAVLDAIPSFHDETVLEEMRTTLTALAVHDGKVEPAVLKALQDPEPARRGAAGVALCRADVKEHLPAIRTLLKDTDPLVRLHVGLTLIDKQEKATLPVLINLFTVLPQSRLWKVEDILYRLAQEKAPSLAVGEEGDSRARFRDAWLAWWKTHGEKLNLAALHQNPYLDRTIVVLLDKNELVDLDSDDKPRYTMKGLGFPLDVQALPGDRVLLAEHHSNKVTERFRDGTILWEYKIDEPLVAQRLPNGHTFIGSKGRLVEVDREGKEVFVYTRPDGSRFMRAMRLGNANMAFVTEDRRYVRIDRSGKELVSFGAQVQTYGGRVDVQPNGHVLIPLMYQDRVIEYDARGQVVREFPVSRPIVASRLANGNTVITSMGENRAIELDAAGKEVWEYRNIESRVNRAYRY